MCSSAYYYGTVFLGFFKRALYDPSAFPLFNTESRPFSEGILSDVRKFTSPPALACCFHR